MNACYFHRKKDNQEISIDNHILLIYKLLIIISDLRDVWAGLTPLARSQYICFFSTTWKYETYHTVNVSLAQAGKRTAVDSKSFFDEITADVVFPT